jgi:hypothetical protein
MTPNRGVEKIECDTRASAIDNIGTDNTPDQQVTET